MSLSEIEIARLRKDLARALATTGITEDSERVELALAPLVDFLNEPDFCCELRDLCDDHKARMHPDFMVLLERVDKMIRLGLLQI